MSPEQRLLTKWIFILLTFAGVFAAGYSVRDYTANAEATALELQRTQEANTQLAAHTAALQDAADRNLALQTRIDELNTTHTRSLNEHLAQNAALRTDLAVAQRMRLQGTNCPRPDPGADNPSAGSVGDGAPVELSEETRLLVWDLREDLIRDRGKLEYLQDWARRVMESNPAIEPPR